MRPANPNQRGLQTFAGVMFLPNTGAVGTGAGLGVWNVTGAPTITHPAPTSTSLATQFSRTVYTEIGATNNQVLGPVGANYQFWKGNAANMGGFYFAAMFTIDAWNNDAGRLLSGWPRPPLVLRSTPTLGLRVLTAVGCGTTRRWGRTC